MLPEHEIGSDSDSDDSQKNMDMETQNQVEEQPKEKKEPTGAAVCSTSAAATVRNLITQLTQELEKIRKEVENKENIARRAREEMESVEFQLKQLLSIEDDEPTTSRRRSPTPPPRTPPTTPAPLPSLIEKGRCKFNCGSNTHQFATECDVYATLSDRRERMRDLNLCFRCFKQHLRVTELACQLIPCFYCKEHNRHVQHHVSALCPFMFPQ